MGRVGRGSLKGAVRSLGDRAFGHRYHRNDVVQQRLDRNAGRTRRRWFGEFVTQFDSLPWVYCHLCIEDRVTAFDASEDRQLLTIDGGVGQLRVGRSEK